MEETMTIRLRLKAGEVELEYEGPEQFLKDELSNILNATSTLNVTTKTESQEGSTSSGSLPNDQDTRGTSLNVPELAINSVAQKLGIQKGADLVMAAAAYLTFVDRKDKFSRDDLRDVMQEATEYYEQTKHGKHIGELIGSLVKAGKLNQVAGGMYALPAGEKQRIGAALGISR
jgi:hypothetical protein